MMRAYDDRCVVFRVHMEIAEEPADAIRTGVTDPGYSF